jgi:hypothetical protein
MSIARKQDPARHTDSFFFGRLTKGNWLTDIFGTVLWGVGVMTYMLLLTLIFLLLVPVTHPVVQAAPAFWMLLPALPILLILYATRQTTPYLSTQGIRWNYVRIYAYLTVFAVLYSIILALLLTHATVFLASLCFGLVIAWVAAKLSSTVRNEIANARRGFSALTIAVVVTITMTPMSSAAVAKINGTPVAHQNVSQHNC